MTRTVIISADQLVSSLLESLSEEIPEARLVRTLTDYPKIAEISLLLRTSAPEVIILDFQRMETGLKIAGEIQRIAPGVQIIGFLRDCSSQSILPILHAGARDILSMPVQRPQLEAAMAHSREQLDRLPPLYASAGDLYCFLPVKGGVGATTIAVNTAVALARRERANPLLIDFDLNAGMVRFHLALFGEFCTEDAVERVQELHDKGWDDVVSKVGDLDVIHTTKLNPDRRLAHQQIRDLTDLAVRVYSHVLLDFSQNLEFFAQSAMQNATRIFLVSTPELHALYLAREKLQFLKDAGLGSRISLVLNRSKSNSQLSSADAAKLVDVALAAEIPNDYEGAQQALKQGCAVKPESDLGKAFKKFAGTLKSTEIAAAESAAQHSFRLPFFNFAVGR